MGNYIDADYLVEVIGARALQTLLADRREDGIVDFDDATNEAAIVRAIASAEGVADSKLGRRFSIAELELIEQEIAVRSAIARIAAYELAPSSMSRSEQLAKDHKVACDFLCAIGKGQLATGRADPDPPAEHAEIVRPACSRGFGRRYY